MPVLLVSGKYVAGIGLKSHQNRMRVVARERAPRERRNPLCASLNPIYVESNVSRANRLSISPLILHQILLIEHRIVECLPIFVSPAR